MIKKILNLSSFLIFCLFVRAQNAASLEGQVQDSSSHPIAGATVVILNMQASTITDSLGNFTIRELVPGKYQVHITAIGYAARDIDMTTTETEKTQTRIVMMSSASFLGAVIVTADKREESLQKVPISISSLSSKQVADYRIWNSKEITAIVPNLYSANPGDERNVTSVRGIVSSSYDPAVATYIDGVNQFTLDTYIAQLFDVERIDVLRGPQGTLYGRNAMGGVVNIITRPPTNHADGYAEVSAGNEGQVRVSLGFHAPLVKDKLYFGIAALYDHKDGYYTNTYNNSKFDRQSGIGGNYYLKWVISRPWSIVANVKHQINRNYGVFPLVIGTDQAFAHPYEVDQNATTKMVDNTLNISLSAIYSGDHFNFSSQTAYQSNNRYYTDPIDADFSPFDALTIINNYGKPWNKSKAWTEEIRFSSSANASSPWNWTSGAYFFYQNSPSKQATHFGKDAAIVGSPDSLFSILNTMKSERLGLAVYAQASYTLKQKWTITGGLRYDYEEDKLNVLSQYLKDPDPNPLFDIQPDTAGKTQFSAVSPRLSLDYKVGANNYLYITYSRGFRAGGLTPVSSDPSQPPLYPFKPEYSGNIEFGSKNLFLNNRLMINLTAFYMIVNDVQVPTLVLPQAITVIRNAGQLTSNGVEVELAASPFKGFSANYNFGYTHAVYDNLKVSQNGNEADLAGKRQIFTPDLTSMLALQYNWPVNERKKMNLVLRAEWFSLGTTYFDLNNTIKQDPYNLFNAKVGLTIKHYGIYFWGRNLGDQKYISYAYDFGAVHLGSPLTYGVTFSATIQ
jgi:iron complex outermembrane receptor protein